MITKKISIEKKCCFYASDFHLEMTILPYINKKLEENMEVIILTEKNLKDTLNILISKMNLKNAKNILRLDWNNKNINGIKGKNDLVIIVNGSKEFIEKKNQEIEKIIKDKKVEVIDCYSFEEIKEEIVKVKDQYPEALNNLQKNY